MSRGVPTGYKHNWKYKGHWKERKGKKGWKVDFTAKKSRSGSSKGGLPIGSKVTWNLKGTQTATKVSGRTYKTRFKAKKTLKNVKISKRRGKK